MQAVMKLTNSLIGQLRRFTCLKRKNQLPVRLQQARARLIAQLPAQRDQIHKISEDQRDEACPVLALERFDLRGVFQGDW